VISIEDRIDSCFERSMNGRAPARDGADMKALVAYMTWLSRDVPREVEVTGRGFAKLERPPNIDPDHGKTSYGARCASCHGVDGQGKRAEDGSYRFPPLWGPRSFNIGAGMARLDTAAAFVRHNMPLGQPGSITLWETYEIAAYFTDNDRPDFARKAGDWPKGGKPRDARY
jgi:thiosulfate dehydrogenase